MSEHGFAASCSMMRKITPKDVRSVIKSLLPYASVGTGFIATGTMRSGLVRPPKCGSLLFYDSLGFGTDMLDVDHDGDLDLVVVNGDVLDNVELFNDGLSWRQKGQVFLNDGTARFTELDGRRFPALATPRVGRGSMTLDFDNDGHRDVLVSYNNDHARLFRHHGTSGHWIGFPDATGFCG